MIGDRKSTVKVWDIIPMQDEAKYELRILVKIKIPIDYHDSLIRSKAMHRHCENFVDILDRCCMSNFEK